MRSHNEQQFVTSPPGVKIYYNEVAFNTCYFMNKIFRRQGSRVPEPMNVPKYVLDKTIVCRLG